MLKFLSFLLLIAHGYGMQCFVASYTPVGSNADNTMYSFAIDVLAERPLMINLDYIEFSPVLYDRCTFSTDMLDFTWSDSMGTGAPFASLPVHCHDDRSLVFGLSTHGNKEWGLDHRSVTDGTIFAPSGGSADMLTGTFNARQVPARLRTLTIHLKSNSKRNLIGALAVKVCVSSSVDVPSTFKAIESPRILPITSCITQYGGHCGANLGYIATEKLHFKRQTDENRLLPSSLENGFDLLSDFEPGTHESVFHVGWACDQLTFELDATWRLDGLVLRLDQFAERCGLSVKAADSAARKSKYQASGPQIQPIMQEQVPAPKVYQIPMQVALDQWQREGVQNVYYDRSRRRTITQEESVVTVKSLSSQDRAAFTAFYVLTGATLLFYFVFVLVVWYSSPEGVLDWEYFPHPKHHHLTHPYASKDDYFEVHGHYPTNPV